MWELFITSETRSYWNGNCRQIAARPTGPTGYRRVSPGEPVSVLGITSPETARQTSQVFKTCEVYTPGGDWPLTVTYASRWLCGTGIGLLSSRIHIASETHRAPAWING